MAPGDAAGNMSHHTQAHPRGFNQDVIGVARHREPDVRSNDVAVDFGISESEKLRAATLVVESGRW